MRLARLWTEHLYESGFLLDSFNSLAMMTGNLLTSKMPIQEWGGNLELDLGSGDNGLSIRIASKKKYVLFGITFRHHQFLSFMTGIRKFSSISSRNQVTTLEWSEGGRSGLKSPCPLLPRFQLPPPEVEFEVHHMKHASGGDCFQFTLWVSNAGQLRYEWAPPQVTQLCSTAFTGAGTGTGDVCLSRSRALTISFNSATSGDTLEEQQCFLVSTRWSLEKFCNSTGLSANRTMGSSTSSEEPRWAWNVAAAVDVDVELENDSK
ncbi:hypothetical protein Tco_1146136 [Tanacetum coccineum]